MKRLDRWMLAAVFVAGGQGEAHADPISFRVSLAMKDDKCIADLAGPLEIAHGTNVVLLWTFTNTCATAQAVEVCVKSTFGATHPAPWNDCTGVPANKQARPGSKGELAPVGNDLSTKHSLCGVNWPVPDSKGIAKPDKYRLFVANAPAGADPKCMSTIVTQGSELAMEVLP